MDLTPKQLIEDVEFQQVRRGYDPAEVDEFLDRVAAAMAKLQQQLADANQRVRVAEVAAQQAQQAAPQPTAPLAAPDEHATAESAQRTLVLAQRTADAAVAEARQEADAIRSAAQAEADRLVATSREEARRASDEARDTRISELRELEATREALRGDISILERHVDEHRGRLKSAVGDLSRLLDDPVALRVNQPAGLSDAEVPAPSEPTTAPTQAVDGPVPPAPTAPAPPPPPGPTAAAAPVPADDAPAAAGSGPADAPHAADGAESDRTEADHHDAPAPEGSAPGAPSASPSPPSPTAAPVDPGPPTQAFDVIDVTGDDHDEDAFLSELRKAMTDDEPLGPRDHVAPSIGSSAMAHDDLEHQRLRSRFGRRR